MFQELNYSADGCLREIIADLISVVELKMEEDSIVLILNDYDFVVLVDSILDQIHLQKCHRS